MALRLAFMGTPAFSVPTLRALVGAGHEIACVYTQPPRAAGRRGLKETPSPVASAADDLGIVVRHPRSLRDADEQGAFAELGVDLAVVVAYGLILPQPVLDAPRLGAINGHASLLPRWRGAAPIQRAIEAGDAVTGTMAMRMEAGLDTGPVAVTRETPIEPSETAGDLFERLSHLTAEALVEAVARLEDGSAVFVDQALLGARMGREPSYARKIDKSETPINFGDRAQAVAARINAFSPFPGAWTKIDFGGGPERVKLLRAMAIEGAGAPGTALDGRLTVACGTGAVRVLELQRAGGRAMGADALLIGSPIPVGARLGDG